MIKIPKVTLGLTVASLLAAGVTLASPRPQQSGQSPAPIGTQQPAPAGQSGQDPGKTQTPPQPTPPQPAPPQPAQTQAPQDQPVPQKDTVHPKTSRADVE